MPKGYIFAYFANLILILFFEIQKELETHYKVNLLYLSMQDG
jgi:hypothetical protein